MTVEEDYPTIPNQILKAAVGDIRLDIYNGVGFSAFSLVSNIVYLGVTRLRSGVDRPVWGMVRADIYSPAYLSQTLESAYRTEP